jgi:NAD(P)-dependent dehydrogenase (short-subunit alcohol dehydrogenase family)
MVRRPRRFRDAAKAPSADAGAKAGERRAGARTAAPASAPESRATETARRPLEGQVALVTGAAIRIGRSIALRLASEGADIVVNYRESKTEAEQLAQEMRASGKNDGRRAIAVQANVSRRADVQKLFAATEKEFGRLDILVNNAGTFFPAKFEELTDEQWDRIMNANLKSQFLCAQAAAPIMKRQGRGRIINLSSLGGILPWPAYTHYCVSKAGCIMLTRCLARALGPEILVNSVAPGTIQFPGEPPDEEYIRRVPLHRTGTGDDIAEAVAYLASADFVTGQVIVVDGGRSLV